MHTDKNGFSLIEVMIVVAVIGILMAIAIPMYNDYVTRAHVTEAVANLSDMRSKLEQFFQDNRTYVGGCTTLPTATTFFSYQCTTACGGAANNSLTTSAYTVRACGLNSLQGMDYTINQNNTRMTVTPPPNWSGAGSNCWVTSRSGGC